MCPVPKKEVLRRQYLEHQAAIQREERRVKALERLVELAEEVTNGNQKENL